MVRYTWMRRVVLRYEDEEKIVSSIDIYDNAAFCILHTYSTTCHVHTMVLYTYFLHGIVNEANISITQKLTLPVAHTCTTCSTHMCVHSYMYYCDMYILHTYNMYLRILMWYT